MKTETKRFQRVLNNGSLAQVLRKEFADEVIEEIMIVCNSHASLTAALDACVEALEAAQKEISRGGHADRWKTIHDYIEPALDAAKKARQGA